MTPPLLRVADLERAVQVVGCPYCGAVAGAPCVTPGGRPSPTHLKRYDAAREPLAERAKLAAWNAECKPGAGP